MGESKISWTHETWNFLRGCKPVSAGCDHCYAGVLASTRLAHLPAYDGLAVDGAFTGKISYDLEKVREPLTKKRARMYFVNSMSDLFYDEVPEELIARAFAVMGLTTRHTYQILTKRPARMRSLMKSEVFRYQVAEAGTRLIETERRGQLELGGWHSAGGGSVREPRWPLPNVWLGVSAEDQRWANVRWPVLADTPAAVRFVSAEPLLSPIDFDLCPVSGLNPDWMGGPGGGTGAEHPLLDWVIVGGESGADRSKIRPMMPDWAHRIEYACEDAGVAFFFKQYGTRAAHDLGLRGAGSKASEWPYVWPQQFPRVA